MPGIVDLGNMNTCLDVKDPSSIIRSSSSLDIMLGRTVLVFINIFSMVNTE